MEAEKKPIAETAQPGGGARGGDLTAALLLLALIALVFAPSLRSGFVYDDRWTILDNPIIRAPANLRGLLGRELVRAGIPDAARPTMLATEVLDWALWRARPRGWHLQNLLWHAGVALLLFAHLRRWGLATLAAFGAAALFAVHPLVVEPVAAINYREDLLAAFFVLLSLWLAAPGARLGRLVAGGAALLLGGLAKENALVAPLLLLVTTLAPGLDAQAGPAVAGLAGRARAFIALLVPMVLVLGWRGWALGQVTEVSLTAEIPGQHRHLLWVVPRAALTFCQGLGQLVWPAGLAPEYPDLPASGLVTLGGALALVVIIAVSWAALQARHRLGLLSLGWLFAVVAYLPNFGLVPLTNLRADRYLYLPALGVAMSLGWLFQWLGTARATATSQQGLRSMIGLLVLGLGARSWRQQRIWHDDVALFSAAIASDPGSQRALLGLATAQLRRGQTLAALEAAERALALGDSTRPREVRGLVRLAEGDVPRARQDLEIALAGARGAHRAQVLNNLGLAEIAGRDPAAARAHLRQAVAIAPRFDRPALQLARLDLEAGDLEQARRELGALLARVPESRDGWRLLATVETRAGHPEAARAAEARAAQIGGE
jgi:Tfp pilus assembly protein PilF